MSSHRQNVNDMNTCLRTFVGVPLQGRKRVTVSPKSKRKRSPHFSRAIVAVARDTTSESATPNGLPSDQSFFSRVIQRPCQGLAPTHQQRHAEFGLHPRCHLASIPNLAYA